MISRFQWNGTVSDEQLTYFIDNGFLYFSNFYDFESEISPIIKDIHLIISLLVNANDLKIELKPFSKEDFDSGLSKMVECYRHIAGNLYDVVKKIPSYARLANCSKHEALAQKLLRSKFIGFANRGYGLRMDHPNEDGFLTQWHQDYVSQLCSPSGIVLWSPLRDVTGSVGPVRICPGSHMEGIFPIIKDGEGSYGLKIREEKSVISRYKQIVPEVNVCDLIVMDFKTLHCSSPNRSEKTRWAMISRYFDFYEPCGLKNSWKGGLQEGGAFENLHPDLISTSV